MSDKAKALTAIGVVCLLQALAMLYAANRLALKEWMAPILFAGIAANIAILIYNGRRVKAARQRSSGPSKIHFK